MIQYNWKASKYRRKKACTQEKFNKDEVTAHRWRDGEVIICSSGASLWDISTLAQLEFRHGWKSFFLQGSSPQTSPSHPTERMWAHAAATTSWICECVSLCVKYAVDLKDYAGSWHENLKLTQWPPTCVYFKMFLFCSGKCSTVFWSWLCVYSSMF